MLGREGTGLGFGLGHPSQTPPWADHTNGDCLTKTPLVSIPVNGSSLMAQKSTHHECLRKCHDVSAGHVGVLVAPALAFTATAHQIDAVWWQSISQTSFRLKILSSGRVIDLKDC